MPDVNGSEFTGAKEPGQLIGVAVVGPDAIGGFLGDEGGAITSQ